MATNTDRLIKILQQHPGLDDDQLAVQAGVQPRQQVNQICNRLMNAGTLRRTIGPDGKIINTLTDVTPAESPAEQARRDAENVVAPGYKWQGRRQAFLRFGGYPIIQSWISYFYRWIMPLYIKDEKTTQLVNELARQRGSTKQDAVKFAVQAELDRGAEAVPLREKLARWRQENPLPEPTGLLADKAFFDDLSGEP